MNTSHSLFHDDWPADKPLFKFFSKQFAEKFFNTGELRIGTLSDFRNQEQHGDHRGDKNEGEKETFEHIDHCLIKDPTHLESAIP